MLCFSQEILMWAIERYRSLIRGLKCHCRELITPWAPIANRFASRLADSFCYDRCMAAGPLRNGCFLTRPRKLRRLDCANSKATLASFPSLMNCNNLMDGLLIIRAGDILFDGAADILSLATGVQMAFRTGDSETIASGGTPVLPHQPYMQELPRAHAGKYIRGRQLGGAAALKSASRHGVGARIWIRHPMPEVGYVVAKMATEIAECVGDAEKRRRL